MTIPPYLLEGLIVSWVAVAVVVVVLLLMMRKKMRVKVEP